MTGGPQGGRTVLVSAAGDHADPWHPFPATSALLVELLEPVTGPIEVRDDVEGALADLVHRARLLVLNLGDAGPERPSDEAAAGLLAHVAAGRPILALHSSTTTYPGWARWQALLGGRWVRDVTFHPDRGPSRVKVVAGHPLADGLGAFDTVDERYTALRTEPGIEVLAVHELEGEQHPLAWTRDGRPSRVAYVALGHDEQAYASEGMRELIRRSAAWLLGVRAG